MVKMLSAKKSSGLAAHSFAETPHSSINIGQEYSILPIVSSAELLPASIVETEEESADHYLGHRARLRDRFLNSSPGAFSEYELLELLLFSSIARKDVKPLAKTLLKEFGSIGGVINASKEKLMRIKGITKSTYTNFLMIHELLSRMLQSNVMKKNILSSWSSLLDYLRVTMGDCKTEQFRILFLNKKNMLIADELQTLGTIDQTPVYPREVLKRALFHEASAIILVHNHPSGDASPSKSDVELTKAISIACNTLGINVHDHVIVTSTDFYSFKSNLLL